MPSAFTLFSTEFISRQVDSWQPKRHLLLWVLMLAAGVRIAAAFLLGNQVQVLPGTHDQVSYYALAQSLLAGQGYQFSENWYPFTPAHTPTAHWSFAYPLYLVSVYALFGDYPLLARLIQGVVGGVLLCLLIYKVGEHVTDRRVALVAAGLAAVYSYFIYYSVALMTETFSILLILASLWLALELRASPGSRRHWLLLGITLGVAALLRQTILLFAPVLLLWLFWQIRGRLFFRHVMLPVVVIGLLILPWTVRNYLVYDQFLLLNSNAGYALYASNHPQLGTNWQNENVVVPLPPELEGLNEATIDRALSRQGLSFVQQDPVRYFWLTLDKSLEYFKFWPEAQSSPLSNVARTLSIGLALPLMLAGIVISLRQWRRFSLLYLFIATHSGIHLLSWPAPRYRLPVDAILLIFAGMALVAGAQWLAHWQQARTEPGRLDAVEGSH